MFVSYLLSFSMFSISSLNVSLFFSKIPLTSYKTYKKEDKNIDKKGRQANRQTARQIDR